MRSLTGLFERTSSMPRLARFLACLLFLGAIGASWDAWWHRGAGRDTFWEPAHILLATVIVIAIFCGIYGWYRTRDTKWLIFWVVLALQVVAGPGDEAWHQAFGTEDLSTLWIVWSPPHLVLIVLGLLGYAMLLPILNRDKDRVARYIFGAMVFASILNIVMLSVKPLHPFDSYHVAGFWGAGPIAFLLTVVIISAQRWLKEIAGITVVMVLFIFLHSIWYDARIAPGIIIGAHDFPPFWIVVFSFVVPAAFFDLFKKLPPWLVGRVLGALWGGILFGFSSQFLESAFQYGASDMWIAVGASAAGGLAGGLLVQIFEYIKVSKT